MFLKELYTFFRFDVRIKYTFNYFILIKSLFIIVFALGNICNRITVAGIESSVFVSDFSEKSGSMVPDTTPPPEFSSISSTTNTNLFIITILKID